MKYDDFYHQISDLYRLNEEWTTLCADHITLTDCKHIQKCQNKWGGNAPSMTSTHHNGASVHVVRNDGGAVYMIGGDVGSQFVCIELQGDTSG